LIFSFIPNPFLYCNLFEYIRKNIHVILFYLQKQLSSIRPAQAVDFWLKWFFCCCFLFFFRNSSIMKSDYFYERGICHEDCIG